MSMMADIKDLVRHHNYQMSDLMQLTPFDFNLIKLMIAKDIQEEIEQMEKSRGGGGM